jgi:hypothetical protein
MKKLLTLALLAIASYTASAQNVYGTMETWLTYTADTATLERPQGWNGSDSVAYTYTGLPLLPARQIFQDTHAHSGQYAARIETKNMGLSTVSGGLANGEIEVDGLGGYSISGGTPVSQRITFVNAWLDYQPQGSDEAAIIVRAVWAGQGSNGNDSIIGQGTVTSDGTNGYEHFSVAITYIDSAVVPDHLQIGFLSSQSFIGGDDNTVLYVDDVTISTVSVKANPAQSNSIKCYPNPTTGVLNLRSATNDKLGLDIYSITGQKLHSQQFSSRAEADLSNLANGMYYFTIRNEAGQILEQEKLLINK